MTILAITLAALLVLGYPAHRWAVRDRMQRDTIAELEAEVARWVTFDDERMGRWEEDHAAVVDDCEFARRQWIDAENRAVVAEYRAECAETALAFTSLLADGVVSLDAARLARGREAGA